MLTPDRILQSVIFVQASFRRFTLEEYEKMLGITSTTPPPPLAIALAFAKRKANPKLVDLEMEASIVSSIICARDTGPLLGSIDSTYREYAPKLPKDHPVIEMLQERFHEVEKEAEEEVMTLIQDAALPSEARAIINKVRLKWGAPAKALNGLALFPGAQDVVASLGAKAEIILTQRLNECSTRSSLNQLEAEVEKEFEGIFTSLRSRLRLARQSHMERMLMEVQTSFGWPPFGRPTTLARAARWFAIELGGMHPLVEQFSAAVERMLVKTQTSALQVLNPLHDKIKYYRGRLYVTPSPPQLMVEGLKEELDEVMLQAVTALEEWKEDLGLESKEFLHVVRGILGTAAFVKRYEAQAEAVAPELRLSVTNEAEQEEQRVAAAVKLSQLLDLLEEASGTTPLVASLHAEFSHELSEVRPLLSRVRCELEEEELDGWHVPLGFEDLDQPLKPPTPPPTPPPPTPPRGPDFPESGDDIRVKMRLHGITVEDARAMSEILCLEKCALIIAQECGIPREWISNLRFAPLEQ